MSGELRKCKACGTVYGLFRDCPSCRPRFTRRSMTVDAIVMLGLVAFMRLA